jgi:Glyoxalase-like domain
VGISWSEGSGRRGLTFHEVIRTSCPESAAVDVLSTWNGRWQIRLGDRSGRVGDVDLIWEQVVVDAHDPVALGRWWADALDWVVVGDAADEFEIRPTPDRVPGLLFVPVPEEKAGKNRLHLDFRPIDQAAEVERLLSLGARRADVGQGDVAWVVLADPEGNEFCILREQVPTAS